MRARGPRRLPGRACTRSATGPTATRSTRSRRRATSGSRSACGSGSSTRSCSRRRTSPASRSSASPPPSSSATRPSDRDLAERHWAGRTGRRLRVALAARRRRARRQRLRRADRGARPAGRASVAGVLRTLDDRPAWHPEQAVTVEEALRATTRQPGVARGRRAPPRPAPPRLPRRPRRARPRPARVPARRAGGRRGRRDDGRRPLGAQPAALGLSARSCRPRHRRVSPGSGVSPRLRPRAAGVSWSTPHAARFGGRAMFAAVGPQVRERRCESTPSRESTNPLFRRELLSMSAMPLRIVRMPAGARDERAASTAGASALEARRWPTSWIAGSVAVAIEPPGPARSTSARSRRRRPSGAASRSSRSNSGAISSGSWPGASRIETFASALTGSTVFCRLRRAAHDAVHVDGRLRPGADVELVRGARRPSRARALPSSIVAPGASSAQCGELLLGRRARRPARSGSGRRPSSPGSTPPQRLHERVHRVQRRAAEDAGVQVALAGPHPNVEVDEPAGCDVEHRARRARASPRRRSRAASAPRSSRCEELDDRVAAGLLLAVADEANVDRQLAGPRELLGRLQQRIELALVVGDAARVEPAVADRSARTAASPTARAAPAAGRRSGRSRGRSAPSSAPDDARTSPTTSGKVSVSTSSASPPAGERSRDPLRRPGARRPCARSRR